jgi:hypothetical protein
MLRRLKNNVVPIAATIGVFCYLAKTNNLVNRLFEIREFFFNLNYLIDFRLKVPQFLDRRYKNLKTIETLQARSTILTLSNKQIQKKLGSTITTTLDKQVLLEELNKNKNVLDVNVLL